MFPNKCKILQRFKLEGRNQENIGFWSMYMLILVRKHAKRVWFGTKSWCCGYFKSRGSRSILHRLDSIALINKYHQKSSSGQYTHVFFSGKSGWSSPKSWRFNPKRKDQQETYDFGQCACSSWPETCSKVPNHGVMVETFSWFNRRKKQDLSCRDLDVRVVINTCSFCSEDMLIWSENSCLI